MSSAAQAWRSTLMSKGALWATSRSSPTKSRSQSPARRHDGAVVTISAVMPWTPMFAQLKSP